MPVGRRFGLFLVVFGILGAGLAVGCKAHTTHSPGLRGDISKRAEQSILPTSDGDDADTEVDADADGVVDTADRCPFDPGKDGQPCPEAWSYFSLRVLNQAGQPVAARLAFQPHVHKLVAVEDGYAGTMQPGRYVLTVSVPGHEERRIEFQTAANEKALIEIHVGTESDRLPERNISRPMPVAALKPAPPRPIFPADGALLESFRFVWQAQPGATAYRFEISKDATFASVLYAREVTTPVLFRPVQSLPVGELFWRVMALRADGMVGSPSTPARVTVRPLVLP